MLKFLGCYMAGILISIVGFILALASMVFINHTNAHFETYVCLYAFIIWIFGTFANRILVPINIFMAFSLSAISIAIGYFLTSVIFQSAILLNETTYFYTIAICALYILIQGGALYLCGNRTNRRFMKWLGIIHNLSLLGILSAALCFYLHIRLFY